MKTKHILIAILALLVANTLTDGLMNAAGITFLSLALIPVAMKLDRKKQ